MYRVRTEFTGLTGAPYLSTMFFGEVGSTPAGAHAAVVAFWEDYKTSLVPGLSWTVLSEVDEVQETTGEVIGSSTITAFTSNGTGASEPMPFATQGLLRWDTGQYIGGRRVRGKTFLPGIVEGANEFGRPSSGAINAAQEAADVLLGAANAVLVTWSRKNGVSFPVEQGTMWAQWAVLRSRRD